MTEDLRSSWREFRLQFRLFWRTGANLILLILFPLASLVFVQTLNLGVVVPSPDARIDSSGPSGRGVVEGGTVGFVPYGTAGMAALALAAVGFVHLTVSLATAREQRVLKRIWGTPMSPFAYLAGRIAASMAVGVVVVAGILAFASIKYGLVVRSRDLPMLAFYTLAGGATYSLLGIATTSMVPRAQAAHATAYGLLIPAMFTSSLFHAPDIAPVWLRTVGDWLPLQPLTHGIFTTLGSEGSHPGVPWRDMASLAAWACAAGLIVVSTFRRSALQD